MHDPRTFWLTVTNIVLGLLVVALVVGVATGTLCELFDRWKKRRTSEADLDREVRELYGKPAGPK